MIKTQILIVDDEKGIRVSLGQILKDEGFETRAVDSGEAALSLLGVERFEVILLDVWLPGKDGLETISGHANV